MLILSIVRFLICLVGIIMSFGNYEFFDEDGKIVRTKLIRYLCAMALIGTSFVIALFQHTTFFIFHVIFYVMLLINGMLATVCEYYAPSYSCCGRLVHHFKTPKSKALVAFCDFYSTTFIVCSLVFAVICFIKVNQIPTVNVVDYNVEEVVDFSNIPDLDYESIYILSNDNSFNQLSSSEKSIVLDEINNDIKDNCIKKIEVITEEKIDPSFKKAYALYNWLISSGREVEKFYVLCK